MMFRMLHWVTEVVTPTGTSRVTGVYTSIPELIRHGLSKSDRRHRLRLSLCKLNCNKHPFGVWCEPDFSEVRSGLEEFVATDEISAEHREMLVAALENLAAAKV